MEIYNKGKGLAFRHLLFGCGEKDGIETRGKFAEGLKLAMVVLLRNGYKVYIRSNGLEIQSDVGELHGEKVLRVLWRETDSKLEGCLVRIIGYNGDTFESRFAQNKKHLILFADGKSSILEEAGKLYVKDIYVTELKNAEFGYNLWNVALSESRNIANEFDVKWEIMRLWGKVKDAFLLERLMKAIKDGKYESKIEFDFKYNKPFGLEAFRKVFGKNAVIATDDKWSREAEWRGARVVTIPSLAGSGLPTDKEFVIEHLKKVRKVTKAPSVPIWKVLKKIVNDVNNKHFKQGKLLTLVPLTGEESGGIWLGWENQGGVQVGKIGIFVDDIDERSPDEMVGVLIHEIAHALFAEDDNTPEFIHSLGRTAGLVYLLATQ